MRTRGMPRCNTAGGPAVKRGGYSDRAVGQAGWSWTASRTQPPTLTTTATDTSADTSADTEPDTESDSDSEDDGQTYVDRSKIDFDPDDGLLTGTAIDGTSEIPGSENAEDNKDDKGDEDADDDEAE